MSGARPFRQQWGIDGLRALRTERPGESRIIKAIGPWAAVWNPAPEVLPNPDSLATCHWHCSMTLACDRGLSLVRSPQDVFQVPEDRETPGIFVGDAIFAVRPGTGLCLSEGLLCPVNHSTPKIPVLWGKNRADLTPGPPYNREKY
ncbi:hypothetical protein TWF106_003240 [Orbilia oligospora]|uniref:Uncharacterized protein n=1 Tax=Orbilia oligospora TaxID=2813651 RepID=A0A7C8UBV2_ORBOL|nr:hypothetical protein TWF788_003340 [Orbilia oligospora]KAF3209522.1 hypothetical protein TWF679_007347 [Orbilia oligospora]KAF3220851.1 hypothetical protein TWF191_007310 [Orbilia oligospora]KAF3224793.1 hypothetical protein TWF106_003240 [Orbilia oligospora]